MERIESVTTLDDITDKSAPTVALQMTCEEVRLLADSTRKPELKNALRTSLHLFSKCNAKVVNFFVKIKR